MKKLIVGLVLGMGLMARAAWIGPSTGGSGGGTSTASGRVFYVATNGNNANAAIGVVSAPFAPDFSRNGALFLQATNPGDVIMVLPGDYYITNVFINPGITFQGVNYPYFHGTNLSQFSSTTVPDVSSFVPGNNVIIRNIKWEATNTWGTTGSGNWNNFMGCGFNTFTNVAIYNSELRGGPDIFIGSTNTGVSYVSLYNCYIQSEWDAIGSSIVTLTYNCVFNDPLNGFHTLGISPNPNSGAADYSSIFINCAANRIQNIRPYGSVFISTNAVTIPVSPTAPNLNGWYFDNAKGYSTSLGPDGGIYVTNYTTTNVQNNYSYSSIFVTAGSPDSGVNGRYVYQSLTPDGVNHGIGFWTNLTATRTITLNDAVLTNLIGSTDGNIWGIRTNSNLGYVNYDQIPFANGTVTLAGSGNAVLTLATNSMTTNRVNSFTPALFYGLIFQRTNTIAFSNTVTLATYNTNTVAVSAGPGITNNDPFNYILSITAGTGLSLKDGNGNGIATPLLNESIPFKPGWRLTGTAVTALGIAQ